MPEKGKTTRRSKKSTGQKRSARTGASKKASKRTSKSARKSASKSVRKSASWKPKSSSKETKKPEGPPQPTGAERKRKIKRMKKGLLERLEILRGGMEHALGSYQDLGGTAGKGDVSDLAADSLDGDTALQLAESGSSEIAQIGSALTKMDEGGYGKCDICGEDIPWSRLEAVPYATTCIECKRKQELTGGSDADASGWSAVDDFAELNK